jgi:hypothetical protein
VKILFVGPTLPDAAGVAHGIVVRAPAIQGDLYRATQEGASAIGLIDGGFEYTAPVWHKEILHALSRGVAVYGAASMGALRAAECAAFGMVGVGAIANDYTSGVLVDDSDVAQLHAPQELGWLSLTEPLVNVVATLRQPALQSRLTQETCERLEAAARDLHFKNRTWKAILRRHAPDDIRLQESLRAEVEAFAVNRKREDAHLLVDALANHPNGRAKRPPGWVFQETTLWRSMVQRQNNDPGIESGNEE